MLVLHVSVHLSVHMPVRMLVSICTPMHLSVNMSVHLFAQAQKETVEGDTEPSEGEGVSQGLLVKAQPHADAHAVMPV